MTVFLDFETRSEADLRKVGAWAYSEHPSTEVICACWAQDDSFIRRWGNLGVGYADAPPYPDELLFLAAEESDEFEAHNVAFEYAIWHNVCVERYGWPAVPLERWRDTMAVACYYALPAALDPLCRVLGLPGKDSEGDRLITRYSKLHLKTAKREIPPEDLDKFLDYCQRDVELERRAGDLLGELPEEEFKIFQNDLRIGLRGLYLDEAGIRRAQTVVQLRSGELAEEFRELTSVGPGQLKEVHKWLSANDLELPNLQAGTIDELLDEGRIGDELVQECVSRDARRALEIRRQWAKASTKKLDAMLRQRGRDGTAKFQERYHGAVTGRNTGLGLQPLNLPRGYDDVEPEQLVRDVGHGDPRWLDALYGDAMDAVAKATRHWVTAPEGERLLVGDFASIEAVIAACIAGEQWKVEEFRKPEPRVYEIAAERIWKLSPGTVTKETHPEERQDGKKCELAFGFGGALGAWRRFDRSLRHDDDTVLGFVREWRAAHPMIVQNWYQLEDAALEAVTYPGRITGYGEEWFERVDGWLTMILPDGKRIWYWAPEIRMLWPQWHRPAEDEECASGECGHHKRPQVTYMAQKEGRWRRVPTYGGKLFENRVQAIARQVLKPVELRVAAAGYRQVLSVYDEITCRAPEGEGSVKELHELMSEPAGDWCADWPIRVKVWQGRRYKK